MKNGRSGFTLLETMAVVGMVTLLLGVLAPAVKSARTQSRGMASAANLMAIGQGSAMYALDHEGRIFNFTWKGPRGDQDRVIFIWPAGKGSAFSDQQAASLQSSEILHRRTGRTDGDHRILNATNQLPHKRQLLLVLMDYLDRPFPDPMIADPADANQLQWQANPLDISVANNIPYAPDSKIPAGHDNPVQWTSVGVRQRWAYSSSYMSTTSAWQGDGLSGETVYAPAAGTPHLVQTAGIGSPFLADGRFFDEVVFPSAKVYFFEEFDREQAGSPYFAYDHARPEKLMFDGSVNDRASGEANPSWSPLLGKQAWRQRYVPLHTFPAPLGGLGDDTPLSQRYRWTLGGLRGVDYATTLQRR